MKKFTEEEIAAMSCIESAECVVNGIDPVDSIDPVKLACNLIDAIRGSLIFKNVDGASGESARAALIENNANLIFFEPVGSPTALEGCDLYMKFEDGNGACIYIEDDDEYGIDLQYAVIPAIAMPILEAAFKMRVQNG